MAFPTSGLTNNLVHKEGNRAFVYDSALGVWDQVRETERTENKIYSGEIGSGVNFDNAFPFTSTAQNIGKLRIVMGQETSDSSSSLDSSQYYNTLDISFSGFASAPKIFADYVSQYHDAHISGIQAITSTFGRIVIACPRSGGVHAEAVMWVAIGTAS